MDAILSLLFGGLIEGLLGFADYMLGGLWDTVFNVTAAMPTAWFSSFVSGLYNVMYSAAIGLMVIKFLKKMFDIYVLWSDGDPDVEPLQLVINFAKAMVVAICFRYIWENIFVKIGKEILDGAMSAVNIGNGTLSSAWNSSAMGSLGLVPIIFGLIFLIFCIILYFKFMIRGLELQLMIVGVPLACIGLLDNDHGIFRPYINQFSKIIVSTLFQVVVCKVGMGLALSANIWDGSMMMLFWAIACMFLAMRIPTILQEFMIPMTRGGGFTQKVYTVSMMSSLISRAMK